ncbi:hypothetical protein K457DRAFT_136948 [Linnemannia elongata AG-77]|uniref:Uncharacterized protein n=1 Tax=Linnemannia elongata AG-77 TaxID=1314771 RepID=A0A197K1V6_9FUNG|nr:hypothetical protein K457DRAFT_136948 [Linnemannia elongata AG-77]
MGAQLNYQEASGNDEQNHDQAFAQGNQRDDRRGNCDRYMGISREEGEEVDDTVPHELRQLAYQDILSCWAKTMSSTARRSVDNSSSFSKTGGSSALVYVSK